MWSFTDGADRGDHSVAVFYTHCKFELLLLSYSLGFILDLSGCQNEKILVDFCCCCIQLLNVFSLRCFLCTHLHTVGVCVTISSNTLMMQVYNLFIYSRSLFATILPAHLLWSNWVSKSRPGRLFHCRLNTFLSAEQTPPPPCYSKI